MELHPHIAVAFEPIMWFKNPFIFGMSFKRLNSVRELNRLGALAFQQFSQKINTQQNKPAAQASGADPSRCSFTNGQSLTIQQNHRNSWTSNAILIPLEI